MKNKCIVDNCENQSHCKGYCSKHYQEFIKYGKIRERSMRTPNKIITKDNVAIMDLYNIKNEKIAETKFDAKFVEDIKKFKWHLLDDANYVQAKFFDQNGILQSMLLHQYIMYLSDCFEEDKIIDHSNGIILDNTFANLRNCSHNQNCMNQQKQKNRSSNYKGVSWDNNSGKWKSHICVNHKHIHLGMFDDEMDGAKAYNVAAIKYFGEFAKLNKV